MATSRWFRWANTTSSWPLARLSLKTMRPDFLGVGMGQTFGAECPTAGKGGQPEGRYLAGLFIVPFAFYGNGDQFRLTGQLEPNRDDVLDVFGRQSQLPPSVIKLLLEPLNSRRMSRSIFSILLAAPASFSACFVSSRRRCPSMAS